MKDLTPPDFENLEESMRIKLIVEILNNFGFIRKDVYYKKYSDNAETLDRDIKIWKDLKKIDDE